MSSDSELDDEMKRRREEEEHPSKKSKITARTSQKTDEDNISGMEQMMKMMRELAMDIKDIKKEQNRSGDEITQLKNEIKELKDQQSGYKDEIKKLRETNEKAIKQIGQLEKEIKAFSNDIIVFEEPPDVAVEEEIFSHDLTSCFNLAADNGLDAGISSDQNKENTSNQINTDVEPNIDSDYELEST
uniref:Dynein regulatory complex subunit 4-like n=1 Tax=Diabrotica virgifera virgifera TaxID=50390 RepID=A0A6P7FI51_DIAVI